MSFNYAFRDRMTYGVRRDDSSSSSGGKRIFTRRQDRDQAVTEVKEHHQKVLEFCHKHEELRDSKCFCAYHPDDAKCHCFTHFLDDPQCHPASVDCSSDTSNPHCMNMAVAVDTSSSSPDAAAASGTQTTAPSTTTIEPPFATSSSGMSATDMSSTAASPGPVSSVASSKGVNIPVIVGAAVGGVVFLALLYLAIMLCLRRRKKRAERAPSAEFLDNSNSLLRRMHTAGSLPIQSPPTSVYGGVMVTADGLGDMPPAFSPGSFSDPVVEKVIGSVQEREAWHHRDARQGSRDIRSSRGTPVA